MRDPRSTSSLEVPTRNLLRLSAAAGVAAPALFAVILAVVSFIRWPDYNPLRQYISELGIGPYLSIGPHQLQNLNFVVFGVLMIAFALGLWQSLGKGGYKAGPLLVGVFGLGMCLMGIFHLDAVASDEPETATWGGILHLLAFVIAFGSVVPACLILANAFKQSRQWQSYSAISLIAGSAATFCFLMLLLAWPADLWKGLWQILFMAVIFIWIEAIAIKLFRLAPH
jgi:hypothetical protein